MPCSSTQKTSVMNSHQNYQRIDHLENDVGYSLSTWPSYQLAVQRPGPVPKQGRPAWYKSVCLGLGFVFLILILNSTLLGVASTKSDVSNGAAVIFTGSCSQSSSIITVLELVINIISTVLFAISNNCIQLMLSPTRQDIDSAHAAGNWLHVGISSGRNLWRIALWRVTICIALFMSSVPLHLL
jgi:hypothetical protein